MINSNQKKNRCAVCGGLKSAQSSHSITQWIQQCTCNRLEPAADEALIKLCTACGKRVSEGRSGSFTQWIFRADLCKCGSNSSQQTVVRSDANPAVQSDGDDIADADEPTLEIDADKFPTSRYGALSIIGGGAAGTVYLCQDKLLRKRVAIKTLNHLSAEQIMAFQKEAKATSSLQHDNIIKVLDFGITDGSTPYMVMEFAGGQSLDKVIMEHGPLDPQDSISVFAQVAKALSHAHSKGVFHRDVKCSNILLTYEDESFSGIKLIDFGVASFKPLDKDNTIVQGVTLVGSPQYMSPDQALGLIYNARSEIYSVGCSLFEALTGEPPFDSDSALDLINRHAKETPPLLEEMIPHSQIPDGLQSIVSKCLEKDPADRFQNMNELENALTQIKRSSVEIYQSGSFIPNIDSDPSFDSALRPDKKNSSLSVLVPLLVVAGAAAFASIFLVLNSLKPTDMPILSKSDLRSDLRGELVTATEDPRYNASLRTRLDQAIAPGQFQRQMIGQRRWLMPTGQVTDQDLSVLKGRTDFDVLSLERQEITGEGLSYLKDCNLIGISLHRTTLSPAGLHQLAQLKSLREVTMDSTDCNAEALEELATLPKLEYLDLDDTPVNNKTMKAFGQMKSLRLLTIAGAEFVDKEGLGYLLNAPNLARLTIDRTSIKARELSMLRGFRSLRGVCVRKLGLDDTTMPLLTSLPNLRILDIAFNKVSDASVDSLSKMKQLETLQISSCPISRKGIERLRKALPTCLILEEPNIAIQ